MTPTMSRGVIRLVAGPVAAAGRAGQTPTSDEADDHIIRSEN
jgi:hypothetical protein